MKHLFSRYKTSIEVLILLLLSTFPFNWFPDDTIIAGHDAGIPLNPVGHFVDRLYMWTERWGMGSDHSLAAGGFFVHGLEALIYSLGTGLQLQQKLYFMIFLFLPGFCMYLLLKRMFPKRAYLPLIGSVLYMFNHFILQGWFIVERTKFSVYALLPLILIQLLNVYEKKSSPVRAGVISGVLLAILNGGGNAPLYGSMFIMCAVVIAYYCWLYFSRETLIATAKYSISFGVVAVVLSAFWLVPYANFAITEFDVEVQKAGGIEGVIGWAKVISRDTSIINLMRLQGIPDWYQNPLHAYSQVFLRTPWLIVVSLLFPIAAYSSRAFAKVAHEKRYYLLLVILSLVGLIFTAGMHAPTGIIYEFFLRFVPGFIVFRTPYYKFAPAYILPFAILIAFTLDAVVSRVHTFFHKRPPVGYILMLSIVTGIVFYNYPFIDGLFFDYETGGRSTRLSVPSYIYEVKDWADTTEDISIRALQFPQLQHGNKMEVYEWGYHSLSPLTSLLTRKPLVTNSFFLTKNEDQLVWNLYEDVRTDKDGWEEYAKALGFSHFMIRKDYDSDAKGSPTRQYTEYEPAFQESDEIALDNQIGIWDIYQFSSTPQPSIITVSDTLTHIEGTPERYNDIVALPMFSAESNAFFAEQNAKRFKDESHIESFVSRRYVVPTCVRCDLRKAIIPQLFETPLILPGSPFYALITSRDDAKREDIDSEDVRMDYLLSLSLRKLQEVKRMLDLENDVEHAPRALLDHRNLIAELSTEIQKYIPNNSEYTNEVLLNARDFMIAQSEMIEDVHKNAPHEFETAINASFDAVTLLTLAISDHVWSTDLEDEKKYVYTIPEQGLYRIWLRRNAHEMSDENLQGGQQVFRYSIDDTSYVNPPTQVYERWIDLGEQKLDAGLHRITLESKSPELFVSDVGYVSEGIREVLEPVNGESEYRMEVAGNHACMAFETEGLEADALYRISFDYTRSEGDQSFRVFTSDIPITPPLLTNEGVPLFRINDTWQNHIDDRKIALSDTLYVLVCSEYDSDMRDKTSVIGIKDISVRRISTPLFVLEQLNAPIAESQTGKIEIEKINQTKYLVRLEEKTGEQLLTMNQSFSSGWAVYPVGNPRERVSEEEHFIHNGYANMWVIDTELGNEWVVEYRPQYLFHMASIVSIIGFICAIGYLVISRKKHV